MLAPWWRVPDGKMTFFMNIFNFSLTKCKIRRQMIWSDEFDGVSLNLTKWKVETGPSPRNNELHYRSADEVWE